MKKNKGQAMIVLLMVIAIATSLAVQVAVSSLSSIGLDNEYSEGLTLINEAEGCLENAALRFLRNPLFEGESTVENEITCTSEVINITEEKDITCFCQRNRRIRKVGMRVSVLSGVFNFSAIEERN